MLYPNLFTPIKLNKLILPNRIYSTAHAEVYAEAGGLPGERYIKYYEEKAKGGLGMAICGGSSPVSIDVPQGAWRPVNLTTDRVIEPLSRLAEAMHRHGSKIMIQITHMGRRSAFAGDPWPHLVSPSGVREMMHRGNAKIIEIEEMRRIVKDFVTAAKRVQDAGMDGIEVSAAHQHLIDQFWSPRTNQRSDEYGGSLQNRMRFGMEVLGAVREAVGADFCVGLRMCADEFHDDGLDPATLKEIAQSISETGLIDFISVIGSGADTHNTVTNCMPSMALPPEPFVNLAAGIKAVSAVPILHAQGIRDVTQAERIIANGLVDMVGMTRAHIADPHIIRKIRDGQDDQIRQCVGANYCIDRQYSGQDVLCVQNAATSREATMPHIIAKNTLKTRKVVVVGADKMSSIIDYTDRATCVLFGDAAGAVLLEPDNAGYGIMDSLIRSDGSGMVHLYQKAGGSRMPPTAETVAQRLHYVHQEGAAVYKFAIAKMAEVAGEIMSRNNLRAGMIDWLVPHQANKRIIESTAERMGLPMEKVMVTIQKYGNTTNATIPLCLWDYEPKLKRGDRMMLAAFGGGFTWAGIYVQWAYDGASAPKFNGRGNGKSR